VGNGLPVAAALLNLLPSPPDQLHSVPPGEYRAVMVKRRRRRWLVLFALVGLPLLMLAVCLWFGAVSAGPLARANCDRVQLGMTLEDATTILGPSRQRRQLFITNGGPSPLEVTSWSNFGAFFNVYTDSGGRIVSTYHHEFTVAEKLRDVWYRVSGRAAPF
jgi:hypothetical protein